MNTQYFKSKGTNKISKFIDGMQPNERYWKQATKRKAQKQWRRDGVVARVYNPKRRRSVVVKS